jgi:hypothetical protein
VQAATRSIPYTLDLGFWFFILVGLNSGLHACKAGTLPLEPHLQSCLDFWVPPRCSVFHVVLDCF